MLIERVSRSFKIAMSEREVWLVGLMALAIFVPAIWWGLPHATHPLGVHGWDLDAVTGLLTLSELHNLFIESKQDWYLAYPLFHYLVLGAAYTPYLAILYLTGGVSKLSAVYPFGFTDPVSALKHLVLIGRFLTLLMGCGVVVNVYLAARTVWNVRTARLAAIAIALPAPVIYHSRIGTLDIPVLFWISLAVLLIARCLMLGFTVGRGIWLGVFSALAVATKDQAYGPLTLGLIAVVAAHLFLRRDAGTPITSMWKFPVALGISGLITFAGANGLLLNPGRFFGHIVWIRNYDKNFFNVINLDILRPTTPAGYAALTGDIFIELFLTIGPILMIVGVVGFFWTWRTDTFTKILFAMVAGHILLVIWPLRHTQMRYVLFITLIFSFLIARAFALALEHRRNKWIPTAALSVAILGFGWIALRSVDLTYQMLYDARYAASDWFASNLQSEDTIGFFTSQNILPRVPENQGLVKLFMDPRPFEKIASEKPRFIIAQPDFSSDHGSDRSRFFPDAVYQQLTDGSLGYREVKRFETKPLFRNLLLDLPIISPGYYVNPPITVFELTAKQ